MPEYRLYSTIHSKLISWLEAELERQIPGLELHGQDGRLLTFAYQDFKTCLCTKWEGGDSQERVIKITEFHPEEVKAFLKIWVNQWLAKWRKRVTLFNRTPALSKRHRGRRQKAKRIYGEMEKKDELKRIVVQKLVTEGEVCMPKLIAESLIIEEITKRLTRRNEKSSTKTEELSAMKILQGLLSKIKTLDERKKPFIHVKFLQDLRMRSIQQKK